MTLTTTLDLLHKAYACTSRYKVLCAALGTDYPHDKPIDLLTILGSNGLDDALWAMCATEQDCEKIARLMAADFAEQVLPIWKKYSQDTRPELAIKAARDFANGLINREQLAAAWDAAWDAARNAAGAAAGDAAGDAAWAAAGDAARDAAWAAAGAAAGAAARAAARAAAWDAARNAVGAAAGDAAGDAAWDAAGDAAWNARAAAGDAAREKQKEIFVGYLQPESANA